MKPFLSLVVFVLATTTAAAQKIELKINASGNVTWLPDFQNHLYIVDQFVTPGVIRLDQSVNRPGETVATSETKPGAGFTVEVEAGKKLRNDWKLSVSFGLSQMRYDYDTHISQSFYRNDFYLSELTNEYGNTKFTYLTCRPLNVSKTYNRFSVQGGVILNYLVNKKYSNVVALYRNNSPAAFGAFFEEKGNVQKLLFGAHLNTRFAIIRNLEIMLGSQYFFNSLYKEAGTYKPLHDKSKALQVQLGLSYNFAAVFR